MKKVTLNIYDKDRKTNKAIDAVMFDKTEYYDMTVYAELVNQNGEDLIHVIEDVGYMYVEKYYPVKRYAITGVVIS